MSAETMAIPRRKLFDRLERTLYSQEEIRERVAAMGNLITEDFEDGPLTVVTILQGGALFMADLIREIHTPLRLDSISVASYHGGLESSGTITFHENRIPDIEGRDVLVLDDILDTGRTISAVMRKLEKEGNPRSVRSAVLLTKRIERAVEVEADYSGFTIGDEFVVGYGLDYDGEYRNLPVIGVLKSEFIRSE